MMKDNADTTEVLCIGRKVLWSLSVLHTDTEDVNIEPSQLVSFSTHDSILAFILSHLSQDHFCAVTL